MSTERQIAFWITALLAAVLVLWLLSDILLPFVAGMALAYLLDPVADRFERAGMSRLAATATIVVLFILFLVLFVLLVGPLLAQQVTSLAERVPEYVNALQRFVVRNGEAVLQRVFRMSAQDLERSVATLMGEGAAWAATLIASVWAGGLALLNLVSLFVVTPVVAFYLLLDWDRMVAKVDRFLPRNHVGAIREIGREIDVSIAGFVRGQGTVCLLLGLFYAVLLTAVGLNFGLLIGLIAGFISFIPFVGTIIGFVVSVGVAVFQFWPDWPWIAAVIGIFTLGQFIEGNILHPKLIGSYVGLHPVWMMFALFTFGYLFGFVGVLLAVPIAAMIGVLARFALRRYVQSSLYTGAPHRVIRLPHEAQSSEHAADDDGERR